MRITYFLLRLEAFIVILVSNLIGHVGIPPWPMKSAQTLLQGGWLIRSKRGKVKFLC